ncbi:MAG: CRTAC1 family protein, partial [Armatimonadetes bacterium]|nr:CRTAC1 family protein [Armatimonadota bacterium]
GSPLCALFRNEGNGKFQRVPDAAGLTLRGYWMGAATADYNGDGHTDLFLSGYRTAALFQNTGEQFVRVPLPFPPDHWGTSAAFLDYDRDGRLDLYVGCYVRFGPDTPQLCDFGGVQAACSPSHYDPQLGHLYHNEGNGRFRDATRDAGLDRSHGKTLGVAVADFNRDGKTDLYLANDGMPGDLFVNEGDRFTEQGLESGTAFAGSGQEQAGMGVDWGDYNEDGFPDLFVTTFQHEPSSLYLNSGKGYFRETAYPMGVGSPTTERLGFGARFLDADNDGLLDLLIANGHVQDAIARMQPGVAYAQPIQFFRFDGRRFQEAAGPGVAALAPPLVGRAVAVGDYDDDGRVDALVTHLEGSPRLLRNETTPAGNWVRFRLDGRPGARDATGARLTIRIGGRRLTRFAGTSGGYLSCSDSRVSVGLGSARQVDELEVFWPDGTASSHRDLEGGREHTVSRTDGVRTAVR